MLELKAILSSVMSDPSRLDSRGCDRRRGLLASY